MRNRYTQNEIFLIVFFLVFVMPTIKILRPITTEL